MLSDAERQALSRTIAVTNGKGGVGKTSVVGNVGGLFAAAGYRVCGLDLDPQANLAEDLGYDGTPTDDGGEALVLALTEGTALKPVPVRPNFDVIAGGDLVEKFGKQMDRALDGEAAPTNIEALAKSLAAIAGDYDLILIDTPPSIFSLQELALVASRWVLVPTKTDKSSRKGLVKIGQRFTEARALNPDIELLGVLLYGVNKNAKRLLEDARERINEAFGSPEYLLSTTVRHAEASAVGARERGLLLHELEALAAESPWWKEARARTEAEAEGREYRRRHSLSASSAPNLASDFQQLAEELLARLQEAEGADAQPDDVQTGVGER